MNRLLTTACLALAALTPNADAQLLGETLDIEWHYPSLGAPIETHTVIVGAGIELPSTTIQSDDKFDIDVGDNWIEFRFNTLSNWTDSTFNGWFFRDSVAALPPIEGYAFDSASAGVTNTANIVTGFNDDEFWADFGGVSVAGPGEWIRLTVQVGNNGTSFCFGDGSGATCPCGNSGGADEGCGNSAGAGALLSSSGSGSVAADDLALTGSQLPPGVPALFFAGTSVIAGGALFGDGLRCAGGQLTRLEIAFVDGGGQASTTVGIAAALGAATGTQSVLQLWYRDPAGPCGTAFNLSNAIDLIWE